MGRRADDLTGQRFGKLLALQRQGTTASGSNAAWLCLCDCGETTRVGGWWLKANRVRSCGCLQVNKLRGGVRRERGSPEYQAWKRINKLGRREAAQRTVNPGQRSTVAPSWQTSHETFLADVGRRPSPQHQLTRIDPEGNWEPGNVQWLSPVQRQIRCCRIRIPVGEHSETLSALANRVGISRQVIYDRLKHGWDLEKALSLPVRPRRPNGKAAHHRTEVL